MTQKLRRELAAFRLLMKSLPPLIVALFVMSLFSMNLLANKSIALPFDFLALDCGIIVSWFAFLAMDIVTKHFGPKAATQLSLLALLMNLAFCLIFFIGSRIPGAWGESYVPGGEALINTALNNTFGGTWYVLLGSSIAFIVSAFVNNFLNHAVGLALHRRGGFGVYAARSYLSTAVGQFTDNIVFALIVSRNFFGWSLVQCFTCALTGMAAELLCEVIFSGLGFMVCERWQRDKIGAEYFAFVNRGQPV